MVERRRQSGFSLIDRAGGRLKAAGGNIVTARGVTFVNGMAKGFSLMEVLFAVVVLAMGLVFVAAQFPLGIINTAKVADATLNTIDAHNSQVMIKLQLEGTITRGGYPSLAMDFREPVPPLNLQVHPLVKPNVLADSIISGTPELILDDPEDYGNYLQTGLNLVPGWPFWTPSQDPCNYDVSTQIYKGDIGNLVSPPVDESDREVQEQLPPTYDPYNPTDVVTYLYPAIFNVAMERKYSWCALYRCIDYQDPAQPDSYKKSRQFAFYIFTLRNHNKNARYAIQDPTVFGTPTPGTYETDRKFPVPWRIDLESPVTWMAGVPNPDRFYLKSYITLFQKLADILHPGSKLVDAQNGYIYEVLEITLDEIGKPWVRLKTPLVDPLQSFWVIPPAIERDGNNYTFSEAQPVVGVTQKVVRF